MELKESMEIIKLEGSNTPKGIKALATIFQFCQSVLECKGMPEKRKLHYEDCMCDECYEKNACHTEWQAYLARILEDEKIKRLILQKKIDELKEKLARTQGKEYRNQMRALADIKRNERNSGCAGMTHIWRLKKWLSERYGQRCKVTARGAKGSIRIIFEDNFSVITNRFAVRKIKQKDIDNIIKL